MSSPNEKLASSLTALRKLQEDGRRVFKSGELGRVHRERLLEQGFLREVMKGWLISSSPEAGKADTTSWYLSFWEFCGRYCTDRFGDDWHLSPEQSLLLHAEDAVIPRQVIIYAPKGTNNTINLLFETSLYDLKQKQMPPAADMTARDGLSFFQPAAAIIKVPEDFFRTNALEAQVALGSIRDAGEVLQRLLEGGHSVVAGRLAGAFRHIGRGEIADEILATMKAASFDVRETNPFRQQQELRPLDAAAPPIVSRLQAIWTSLRDTVLERFPKAPGLPKDKKGYLAFVDDIYQSDAYHSLSIEGYRVTPDLVDRVRSGKWNPEDDEEDRKSRDALAARGYWQAFQLVRESVAKIIAGEEPGKLAQKTHRDWYRELFQPCVAAGLLKPEVLAGYRNHPVYLRASRHVPPRWEVLRDAMPAYFDLLQEEPEPSVRAVLGHWLFGYIHPYPDGNGRMARFLMNCMLASGGYSWTVIRVEDRTEYLAALESASLDRNIRSFVDFLAERVIWSEEKGAPPVPKSSYRA